MQSQPLCGTPNPVPYKSRELPWLQYLLRVLLAGRWAALRRHISRTRTALVRRTPSGRAAIATLAEAAVAGRVTVTQRRLHEEGGGATVQVRTSLTKTVHPGRREKLVVCRIKTPVTPRPLAGRAAAAAAMAGPAGPMEKPAAEGTLRREGTNEASIARTAMRRVEAAMTTMATRSKTQQPNHVLPFKRL